MPPYCILQTSLRAWEKSSMVLNTGSWSTKTIMSRIWVMLILFCVSLFAAWFPTLSKRIHRLRVPRIVFFIGKHFGTGVILSTAFVHLMQDAFESLYHPLVKARWGVGRWTGLIMLCSLLTIFFVEYISTSFVDRLQSYSSPLPSPPSSSATSRTASPLPSIPRTEEPAPLENETSPLLSTTTDGEYGALSHTKYAPGCEATHPVLEHLQHRSISIAVPPSGNQDDDFFPGGHHRHEPRNSHSSHSDRGPGRRQSLANISDHEAVAQAKKDKQIATQITNGHQEEIHHDHHRHHERHHSHDHAHVHLTMEEWNPDSNGDETAVDERSEIKIGHRRQVVGILMLQIGIMIHSLVIGLTLAITSGTEFTSLVAAIIFHQLFEGLSLGIRIANLPSSPLNAGFTRRLLKPILAFTFAITTPVGIGIGLATFSPGRGDGAYLRLVQGLMSAISAGMLIYAACVEMLAGDFVMDPLLWRSSIKRQVLALGSVLAGVAAMALIGWD
ncbi:unnamed protein product [Somion occarium]|uniref:Zinc/iron permease n=2 Tax=Somion occarium TaxID=3059160 RepID=A0ABP1D7E3_9APHY